MTKKKLEFSNAIPKDREPAVREALKQAEESTPAENLSIAATALAVMSSELTELGRKLVFRRDQIELMLNILKTAQELNRKCLRMSDLLRDQVLDES